MGKITRKHPWDEVRANIREIEQTIEDLPITRVMTKILLPALTRAQLAQARHEALLDILQMGLLLEVFQTENGHYPDSLNAIAPQLGASIPVDPFTGRPYHYSLEGESFLLYSIGENLRDDDGVHDLRDGDIVWRGETRR